MTFSDFNLTLAEITERYNSIPGIKPVKKFRDKATALKRLEEAQPTTVTREEWLNKAVQMLKEKFFDPAELSLPNKIKVSVGFARGTRSAIGQCVSNSVAVDKETTQIFICPTQGEGLRVLDILLHEMIHAHLFPIDPNHKHGPKFRTIATGFGLTGRMTATVVEEGSELESQLKEIFSELGQYPHVAIEFKQKIKKEVKTKWRSFYSKNDKKFKVTANIETVKEYGRPKDFRGDVMVADRADIEEEIANVWPLGELNDT